MLGSRGNLNPKLYTPGLQVPYDIWVQRQPREELNLGQRIGQSVILD
jgi:hypothetical protein